MKKLNEEQKNWMKNRIMDTDKTSIENTNQPSCLGAVIGCCSSSDKISKIYLLDPKDCIFENGVMVRMKRKYGKFKRVVHVIDYNIDNVFRLCDGRQENLIINRDVSGGYCKTAVSRWPFSQTKIE